VHHGCWMRRDARSAGLSGRMGSWFRFTITMLRSAEDRENVQSGALRENAVDDDV
jgi:hypothetical protein